MTLITILGIICITCGLFLLISSLTSDRKKNKETILLFTYGSILIPEMTKPIFNYTFFPAKSVFVEGYRLILQKEKSHRYPDYHLLVAKPFTPPHKWVETNRIAGFLTEVPVSLLERLDRWEGKNYKRIEITCYDRELNPIECQMYVSSERDKGRVHQH